MAGVLAFDWSHPSLRPVAWLLLGVGVIYYFVVRPYLRRSRIKESNAPQQDLALEFHDGNMKLVVSGVGEFTRKWEELVEFIDARKGIIFYFSDGVVNWIPDRVFADGEERNRFVEFITNHQNRKILHAIIRNTEEGLFMKGSIKIEFLFDEHANMQRYQVKKSFTGLWYDDYRFLCR